MTNRTLLEAKVKESGYRLDFICAKLGITYQSWLNKLKNLSEFKQSEIVAITELLHLDQDEIRLIFFSPDSDCESQS